MKRTITLEKNTFYSELDKETKHKVRPLMIKSLLNYSKSLLIIPSSTIKGMSLEVVTN